MSLTNKGILALALGLVFSSQALATSPAVPPQVCGTVSNYRIYNGSFKADLLPDNPVLGMFEGRVIKWGYVVTTSGAEAQLTLIYAKHNKQRVCFRGNGLPGMDSDPASIYDVSFAQ